jgi:hypothetical protein
MFPKCTPLNSYTPGMQRLGSSVWTGDVGVSWGAMQQQPGNPNPAEYSSSVIALQVNHMIPFLYTHICCFCLICKWVVVIVDGVSIFECYELKNVMR